MAVPSKKVQNFLLVCEWMAALHIREEQLPLMHRLLIALAWF
jgi:hypothetical protein